MSVRELILAGRTFDRRSKIRPIARGQRKICRCLDYEAQTGHVGEADFEISIGKRRAGQTRSRKI